MTRLKPFQIGPVTATRAGDHEEITAFGYTAIRDVVPGSRNLSIRTPEGEEGPITDEFSNGLISLIHIRAQDERAHCLVTGSQPRKWRLCLSPSIAAQLLFRPIANINYANTITHGTLEDGTEWVRFRATPIMFEAGVWEVEISPAHYGLGFHLLSDD